MVPVSIPALAPTPVYPYLVPPLTDVTPFTYRDGTTYLEVLEQLTAYVQQTLTTDIDTSNTTMVTNVNTALAAFNTTIAAINNRVGPAPIVTATLTANYTVAIDPAWPTLQPVFFDLTQDATGGRSVTLPAAVTGTVTVNSTAGARTQFWLIPHGDTPLTWHVYQTQAETGAAIAALNLASTYLTQANAASTYETQAAATTGLGTRLGFWSSGTAYTAGQQVLDPAGNVVTALEAHTSGTAYDPSRWYGTAEGFLFANFTYNSIQGEQLNLFYSADGHSVTGRGPNPVYTSVHGLRDPSIINYQGTWVMAHGWDDPTQKKFSIVTSPDLVSWSEVAIVDVSSATGITQAWAPELTVDETGNLYAFFTNVVSSTDMEIWYSQCTATNNFATWALPVKLGWTTVPGKAMDATFQKVNGTWHMFFGDNTYVVHATATALLGPWTQDKSGDWAGWGPNREAPELVRLGPSKWRIYIDRYHGTSPNWVYDGYGYSESTDLVNWSPLVGVGMPADLSQIVIRHGSFLRLDTAQNVSLVKGIMHSGASSHLHAEFFASPSIPGTMVETGMGSMTLDASFSDAGQSLFTQSPAGTIVVNATGKYSIDFHVGEDPVNNFGNGTTAHWVTVNSPTMGRNIARNAGAGGYESSCSASAVFLRAGDTIVPKIAQNTGAAQTLMGRLRITRVG